MGEASATKVCTRCSADVAARPRVKDAKGRYLCRPCFDSIAAERAAPGRRPDPTDEPVRIAGVHPHAPTTPAEPAEDNSLIFDLAPVRGGPGKDGGPCPSCGHFLARGVVVCVNCGYNTATGATLGTSIAVEKVKASKESRRDSHLEAVSRDVHRQAWINAISTLVLGIVAMVITIGVMTDGSSAAFEFYGLTLVILIPAAFLAFVLFALFGAAGGVGFLLILTEIAAICAAFMPVMVLTALIPSRIARVTLRGLIMGGLTTWLLDMDEPNNYIFAAVVFALTIGAAVAAAFLLGGSL